MHWRHCVKDFRTEKLYNVDEVWKYSDKYFNDYYVPDGGAPTLNEMDDGLDEKTTHAIEEFQTVGGCGDLCDDERDSLLQYEAFKKATQPKADTNSPS